MASLMGSLGGGREYVLKIVADVKDAVKGVDDVADKTSTMKDKMMGVGKAVAAGLAVGAVVDFGKNCLDAAADADDAGDMIDSAFGASAKSIEQFAKGAADNMGMSTTAYENMAGKTGQVLTGFGVSQADAAKQTESLAQRAADMAAIWGTDTPTAMEAMTKAMQGQTKGLKQFGLSIDNTEVQARAMKEGYVDASGKVTDAGKAIATQEIILEKTAKYQGEFAKNSGDLGSQQDILRAKMENLQTTIGNALLPVFLKLFDVVRPLIDFVSQNIGWLAPLTAGILAVVAAIKTWTIVQGAFNLVMDANPIMLVVIAIAALVAAVIWAYNNVDWFRAGVDAMASAVVAAFNYIKDIVVAVFNWISANWPLLLAIITGPFGIAVKLIIDNWNTIKQAAANAISFIGDVVSNIWDIISWPFRHGGDIIRGVVQNIKDWFAALPGQIGGFLSNIWHTITQPFVDAQHAVLDYLAPIGDWFRDLPGRIGNFFGGLASAISGPFRSAFNAIRSLWNDTVGGFGFSVPSWVPGIGGKGFNIPRMATGGIVNRPTVALIGEAGPEAVVPLDRGNLGSTVILNVYALTANAEVGRRVLEALSEYERISGHRT